MYRNSIADLFHTATSGGAVVASPVDCASEAQTTSNGGAGVRIFSLATLGRFRFSYGLTQITAPRTANARALLTYCVAHAGQDIARERMLELFWADSDINQARGSFKTALWLIRASLRAVSEGCDEYLYTNKAVVRWDGPATLDCTVFTQCAARCDSHSLRTAFALYAGDFLEGDYGQWAVAERARIADMYENVLVRMLAATPDPQVAERLLERNPYSEAAYRVLIADRLAVGCFRSAERYAQRCITALAEVGERPSADFPGRYT